MSRTITVCLVTLLFAGSSAEAGPKPVAEAENIATVESRGTTFNVSPQVSFDRAVLRISGPEGYELTKRLAAGAAVFADLAAERDVSPEVGSGALRTPAGGLQDGRYGYEITLVLEDGSARTQVGFFRVEGGAIVSPEVRSGLVESRQSVAARGSSTVDNFLTIADTDDDGDTVLQLNSGAALDAEVWLLRNDEGLLQLEHVLFPTNTDILSIESSGQVGIGTTVPSQELHVVSSDGGDIRLSGSSQGEQWDVGINGGNGSLNFNDTTTPGNAVTIEMGTPEQTLRLTSAGRVGIGTASPAAMLHVTGSFRADGDVTLFSSRAVKTAISSVNPVEMLSKVAELDVASWRYQTEDESRRHIGPFAEDFQRLFGVGNGETISVIDAQGVTLAAIQGLQQELAANDAEMATLQAENVGLRSRLAAIEARLGASEGKPE